MLKNTLFERVEKIRMSSRIMIVVGTFLVLGGVFAMLFYFPKNTEISKAESDIKVLTQRLQQAKIRAKNLEKFEAEQAAVEAQFQEALKLLPNKREIPSLLKNISRLGSESQLEFRLFGPQKERIQDFYIEIPVAMEVSGNYHDVATFFNKVGEMRRIVNILDVSMKPEKELDTTLVTQCTAVTYRFREQADVEDAEKAKK